MIYKNIDTFYVNLGRKHVRLILSNLTQADILGGVSQYSDLACKLHLSIFFLLIESVNFYVFRSPECGFQNIMLLNSGIL
jgi:hypothetical protein